MSQSLAICLPLEEAALLGKLRRHPGIEICTDGGLVWLRATTAAEDLEADLKVLPGVHFSVLPDGQLVEFGKRVPRGHLPKKQWMALSQWINVEVGAAALGGWTEEKVHLRLVRSSEVAEPNLLRTFWEAWKNYALTAPQIRLDVLSFAIGEEGNVLVRGIPLPPCPGVRYVEQSNIAVEAGWKWLPKVDVEIVRSVLNTDEHDLAVFHADQSWDLIPADAFVRASRSAVRLFMTRASHG